MILRDMREMLDLLETHRPGKQDGELASGIEGFERSVAYLDFLLRIVDYRRIYDCQHPFSEKNVSIKP